MELKLGYLQIVFASAQVLLRKASTTNFPVCLVYLEVVMISFIERILATRNRVRKIAKSVDEIQSVQDRIERLEICSGLFLMNLKVKPK